MKTLKLGVAAAVAAVLVVAVGARSAFGKIPVVVVPDDRESRTVEGVQFSFGVPWKAWESHSLYISRSTFGPQDAEAVIFWAGVREDGAVVPCARLLSPAKRGSTADVGALVARAPGTRLVQHPRRVIIGGHPATQVVLTVREDLGCHPGFFFSWRAAMRGAFWPGTSVGDTIRVWIVDVGRKRLFIQAQTKDARGFLSYQIGKIVQSIRFE